MYARTLIRNIIMTILLYIMAPYHAIFRGCKHVDLALHGVSGRLTDPGIMVGSGSVFYRRSNLELVCTPRSEAILKFIKKTI